VKKEWKTGTLGDICRVYQPETLSQKQLVPGPFPVFGANGQIGWHDRFNHDDAQLILGCRGSCGTVHTTPPQSWINGNAMVVQPKVAVMNLDFLAYALRGGIEIADSITGTAQPQITRTSLMPIRISYPAEIDEQERIVGILDEAFAGIATAKAHAEANRQNARALFESHLHAVFTHRGPGWVDRTLDQVCIVERGSSPRPIKEYFTTSSDGVNWIKISDTEEGGKYVFTTAQKITREGAKHSRFVKEGDFILTNSMSFGRPYIMKTSGYIHDGWFVLRLSSAIDTDYFYYILASRFVQSQFATLASGSVVKNISGDLVKQARLPIPPLDHQRTIVEKLIAISTETQRLEALYAKKLERLDELKKALLHQAFSGQL
jgi:type I restriction enzyme S subunit